MKEPLPQTKDGQQPQPPNAQQAPPSGAPPQQQPPQSPAMSLNPAHRDKVMNIVRKVMGRRSA